MWRAWAQWLWIGLAMGISVCEAGSAIPVRGLTVKGVYATKDGDPTIYCLLGAGACEVAEDSGAADAFIGHWLGSHPGAVAIAISEEIRVSWVRGTVMPRQVFVWVADRQDSLTLALVQQGFYPAAAFQDMVARDQAFQEGLQRAGVVFDQPVLDVPARNRPRRLVTDTDYSDRASRLAVAEGDARRLRLGIWSDRNPHENDGRTAGEMSGQVFLASELYVNGIHAHRLGDPDIYCLLGGVSCEVSFPVPSLAPGEIEFVQHWLRRHPRAQAVPMSAAKHKRMVDGPVLHSTYVWIEDGRESLNVELVRNGFYRTDSLEDMLAYDRQFRAEVNDDAELRKEREETGTPLRLVSDEDYAARMARGVAAEREAERNKRGLWSEAVMPLWRPPSDEQMIAMYRSHKASFARIASLLEKDGRLEMVNWDPKSWAAAAQAGVSQADIDTYARLVKELGVNQETTGVVGLGKFCLITSDIVYGIFDTGVIKGYVFSPGDPHPLVEDLEEHGGWDRNATTAYRKVDEGWYLFEVEH